MSFFGSDDDDVQSFRFKSPLQNYANRGNDYKSNYHNSQKPNNRYKEDSLQDVLRQMKAQNATIDTNPYVNNGYKGGQRGGGNDQREYQNQGNARSLDLGRHDQGGLNRKLKFGQDYYQADNNYGDEQGGRINTKDEATSPINVFNNPDNKRGDPAEELRDPKIYFEGRGGQAQHLRYQGGNTSNANQSIFDSMGENRIKKNISKQYQDYVRVEMKRDREVGKSRSRSKSPRMKDEVPASKPTQDWHFNVYNVGILPTYQDKKISKQDYASMLKQQMDEKKNREKQNKFNEYRIDKQNYDDPFHFGGQGGGAPNYDRNGNLQANRKKLDYQEANKQGLEQQYPVRYPRQQQQPKQPNERDHLGYGQYEQKYKKEPRFANYGSQIVGGGGAIHRSIDYEDRGDYYNNNQNAPRGMGNKHQSMKDLPQYYDGPDYRDANPKNDSINMRSMDFEERGAAPMRKQSDQYEGGGNNRQPEEENPHHYKHIQDDGGADIDITMTRGYALKNYNQGRTADEDHKYKFSAFELERREEMEKERRDKVRNHLSELYMAEIEEKKRKKEAEKRKQIEMELEEERRIKQENEELKRRYLEEMRKGEGEIKSITHQQAIKQAIALAEEQKESGEGQQTASNENRRKDLFEPSEGNTLKTHNYPSKKSLTQQYDDMKSIHSKPSRLDNVPSIQEIKQQQNSQKALSNQDQKSLSYYSNYGKRRDHLPTPQGENDHQGAQLREENERLIGQMQREPEEAENEIVKNYNKRIQMALEMESKRLRDEVERGSEMLSSQLNNLRGQAMYSDQARKLAQQDLLSLKEELRHQSHVENMRFKDMQKFLENGSYPDDFYRRRHQDNEMQGSLTQSNYPKSSNVFSSSKRNYNNSGVGAGGGMEYTFSSPLKSSSQQVAYESPFKRNTSSSNTAGFQMLGQNNSWKQNLTELDAQSQHIPFRGSQQGGEPKVGYQAFRGGNQAFEDMLKRYGIKDTEKEGDYAAAQFTAMFGDQDQRDLEAIYKNASHGIFTAEGGNNQLERGEWEKEDHVQNLDDMLLNYKEKDVHQDSSVDKKDNGEPMIDGDAVQNQLGKIEDGDGKENLEKEIENEIQDAKDKGDLDTRRSDLPNSQQQIAGNNDENAGDHNNKNDNIGDNTGGQDPSNNNNNTNTDNNQNLQGEQE